MSVHEGSTDVLTQWKTREHLNDKREKFREFVEINIYIAHEVRLLQFLRSEHVLSKTVMKLAEIEIHQIRLKF